MSYVLKKIGYYALIIALILSGPALLLVWKWYVEPNWGTVEAIVAVKTIERGARVAESDIVIRKIRKDALVEHAVLKMSDAIGKETSRTVRGGEQITADMVNTGHLYPGKGEWNMPFPPEWIFGKPPGSLLRGDHISLLLVTKEDGKKAEEKGEGGLELLDRQQVPVDVEDKLQNMTVSYAKGTNNQEIAPSEDRKKPSGALSALEIIVTDEQKELIRKYGAKGYRFLIVYR
ncbi:SAF domain-containing protein [Paenibacillus thalictri]|uniref:SAF domain-containing protein n=1 Tax=Paenibacillus thalictri TaxID=2527873 RepID=A0A4Q9DZB4_9BACL|nr:SAF domain-containing protein [Paenibacillus thalictri]TBL80611.1 hypothetical protein EYB31_05115 [Paenibacillus thalictri]